MKRITSIILAFVMLIGILPLYGNAMEVETIYYEDGSYATIEIFTYGMRASTTTGTKTYNYYNSSNVRQWKVVLTGSFSYTGSSASCTSSSMDVTIYNSNCYVLSKSASKSGNTASGTATVGEKLLGVTVSSIPVSLTLSCDANGNLS